MMRALTLSIFSLFLLGPLLAGLLGVRAEQIENRELKNFPEWRAASWLDRAAYAELGAWLKDVLPLRAQGIALDSLIDYELLRDSPSAEVLIGRDGELFLTDSLRWPCQAGAEPDAIVHNLARFGRLLRSSGRELYVIFSPNKAYLHSDKLPRLVERLNQCGSDARNELRELLAQADDFISVDAWSEFERASRKGQRFFPRLDRHWGSRAAILQTRLLVEAIQSGLWDPQLVERQKDRVRASELPEKFMNLHVPQSYEAYRLERPEIEFRRSSFAVAPGSKWTVESIRARSDRQAFIPGRTLVVHDSFMLRSRDSFSRFTEQVQYLRWEDFVKYPEESARLFAEAERVVFQLVEDRRRFDLANPDSRLRALRAGLAQDGNPPKG